ncbi:isoamylase 2, chloroplastic [Henckelia pumila]|uniref:isoamylase 2, chloroplastic n=1 Tax=Henckelia pumila TaxID=405737 RepID=UPI003C6DBCA0
MTMLPVQYACPSCGAFESSDLFAVNFGKNVRRVTRDLVKFDLKQKIVKGGLMKSGGRISLEHHVMKALATSDVSVVRTTEKVASYRFRTEIGGQLKVVVRKKNNKYEVHVEVSTLHGEGDGELIMSWGLFRSESSIFMPLNFQQSSTDSKDNVVETPFIKNSGGQLTVVLDFDASLAPFYVSILLKSSNLKIPTIKSHRKTNFVVPVGFGSGRPFPLGLSFLDNRSINFAFFSSSESVVLCLYSDTTADKPALEIDLDPYVNRSGYIWHALIENSLPFVSYGYRCSSGIANRRKHVLLDPYAKVIKDFGVGLTRKWLGKLCEEPPFDWAGEFRPSLPLEKLIVYRLNVTRFTKDKSSKLPANAAGSFYGIYEKLHHFKDLGVNAVLLEPIFPFDEQKGPYFPWHFFSPGSSYGPSGDPKVIAKSMKEMVKKLHASGIEVLLEVVFTHTGEDVALRGIDDSYYHAEEDLKSENMLNCNYPVVQQMILESLRHWVVEYHIDGFCFINASSLLRDKHGEFLSRPTLVEAIAFDPLLSKIKIIADSWDPHDMETKEVVFPHWKRWAEMNGNFCVDARKFLRGRGSISSLATRFCGSGDMFLGGRGPAFSFNFITRNVGLTMTDLVSFSSEEVASQLSWNCGEEGPTNKTSVLERRLKQIRNFLFILFISLGVPVLNMGDECGQSCAGSLAYADRKPLDWNSLRSGFSIQITQFISFLCSLKMRRSDLLQRKSFLEQDKIEWHGTDLSPPKWDDTLSKFVAVTLKVDEKLSQSTSGFPKPSGDLFVAFNSANQSEEVALPPLPDNSAWVRLVDTALPFPGFFSVDGVPLEDDLSTYEMKSHSCVLFEAQSL